MTTPAIPLFKAEDAVKSGLVSTFKSYGPNAVRTYSVYWYELNGTKAYAVLNGNGEPFHLKFTSADEALDFIELSIAGRAA